MSAFAGMIAPSRFSRLLLAADLLAVLVALSFSTAAWVPLTLVVGALWIVVASGLGHYDLTEPRSLFDDLAMATVLVAAAATAVAAADLVVAPGRMVSVDHFLLGLWPAAMCTRMLARLHRPAADAAPERVLIVGVGPLGRATAESLVQRKGSGVVAGFLRFASDASAAELPAPLLGTDEELRTVMESTPVGEVYLAGHALREATAMQKAIHACEVLGVPFALPVHDFRMHHALPADIHGIEDGYLHYQEVEARQREMAFKRLFDIAASSFALAVLSPLLLTVAALVKLTSKGPVLFRQPRLGLHGRIFHMLKFRSMVVNAEALKTSLATSNEQSGPVFKMKDDPRVTPIGRFIRKHSIDELPQLINVLRGEMSVVGPRPPVASEVAKYQPWQRRRLSVRPGLTCIWQVSGRNQIGFEKWMYLDLQYIDHWSLLSDLRLILKTFPVVLTGHGAS